MEKIVNMADEHKGDAGHFVILKIVVFCRISRLDLVNGHFWSYLAAPLTLIPTQTP
jgi:hypothetical protein